MENAKAMAADLDTKLNETVGMDDEGNPIETPVKAEEATAMANTTPSTQLSVARTKQSPAAAAASIVPSSGSAIKIAGDDDDDDDDNDAWNDDFDVDDDDEIKPSAQADTPKAIPLAKAKITTPDRIKTESINRPATTSTKNRNEPATTATQPSLKAGTPGTLKDKKLVVSASKKMSVVTPPSVMAPTKESPESSTKPVPEKPLPTIIPTATEEASSFVSTTTATKSKQSGSEREKSAASKDGNDNNISETAAGKSRENSGWDGDDDLDIEMDGNEDVTNSNAIADDVDGSASKISITDVIPKDSGGSGWDGDDDLDIEMEGNEDVTNSNAVADDTVGSPPKISVADTTPKDTDGPGWEGDDDLDIGMEGNEDVAGAIPDDTDSSPAKDSVAAHTPAPTVTTDVMPVSDPSAATKTPVGGLFSNFANLAKTADSFLTTVQKSGEADKTVDVDEDDRLANDVEKEDKKDIGDSTGSAKNESTQDLSKNTSTNTPNDHQIPPTTTTPKSKPVSSTLKFTPGGGLFSNLTELAKTADSMLTAAVQDQSGGVGDAAITDANNPLDNEGWDEDNDDAFFDDDDDDEITKSKKQPSSSTDTSQDKGKAEESTLSFVKVSPSSSISTPEVVLAQLDSNLPKKETEKLPRDKPIDASPETGATVPSGISNAPVASSVNDDERFKKLQEALRVRENQLVEKAKELQELQLMFEDREEQYKKKLHDTKEEAKKRILRAKERCEAAEANLKARSAGDSEDLKKKQSIIDELMEEGQALAQKQSIMERSVRDATGETRKLKQALEEESYEKEQALKKIQDLEAQCKDLKDSLASARKGESQAGKLENNLLSSRADAEEKAGTISALQQRLKEMTAESKELKQQIDDTQKSAAHVAQQEKTSMRREHNDLIGDLEQKLRTTDREAGVREDALRHEISEVRKRWQDAVRRADGLNMDIQSSTAPLLRQLESMERQNRMRASNSAELESRLRSELEEATIENERLGKESSDFKAKLSKLERSIKDRDQRLTDAQSTVEEQAKNIDSLRNQEEKLLEEAQTRQAEYERVERLANEGVARVRSEMSQTVTDSEERYRGQIDKLQKELTVEAEKRSQLEAQVGQLLESGGGLFAATQSSMAPMAAMGIRRESKPKKLNKTEGQAEILAGALGLGDDSDSDSDSDENSEIAGPSQGGSLHSFAAIEQLSSRLKSSEVELSTMRKSLKESNEIRQSLVKELGEARNAKEKLPLFEAKVNELTQENRVMEMEIAGLKEDIADVKDLYRTQLNVLLEEKTATVASDGAGENHAEAPTASENSAQSETNDSE